MSTPLRTTGPLAGTPRKGHGIGFSAPMVLANHEGRKRMTRRVVTPFTCDKGRPGESPLWKNIDLSRAFIVKGGGRIRAPYRYSGGESGDPWWSIDCRYQVGDLIWQREAWAPADKMAEGVEREDPVIVAYRADKTSTYIGRDFSFGVDTYAWNWDMLAWKPSIHMPRFASRSLYEITGMRAELVTGISEEDAEAEGLLYSAHPDNPRGNGHRSNFRWLWDSINAKRGYPWDYRGTWSGIVWVIEYRPLVVCWEEARGRSLPL